MEQKAWYKSKVVWLNTLSIIVLIMAAPEVSSVIPTSAIKYVAAINAAINIILRVNTAVPLGAKTKDGY